MNALIYNRPKEKDRIYLSSNLLSKKTYSKYVFPTERSEWRNLARSLDSLRSLGMTALVFLLLCPALFADEIPLVRVLVSDNQKMLRLTVKGAYRIKILPSQAVVKNDRNLIRALVRPTPSGIRVGDQEWAGTGIRIEPLEPRDLYVGESRFRGAMDILKNSKGIFYAINRLPIEDYLYGVLHHEVGAWWPMEALKAQAIASRTYALYESGTKRAAEYDLKSSTSSQVYGGSTTERYRTNRAVDLTRGKVLTYLGKPFPAYFHATCAGITAGAQELWAIHLPPISGGVHCTYCRISPHYEWHTSIPLSDIEQKMVKNGRPVGRIISIEPVSQTPSQRVGRVRIAGTGGETVLAAKDFRIWIGGDKMRSTAFTVSVRDDKVEFKGRGWGHGVGLCQWGALGQSFLGKKFSEILEFYYPSSTISSLWGD